MKFLLILPLLGIALTSHLCADSNLLQNGNFESGNGKSVTKWYFMESHLPKDPADVEKVVWESYQEESGNRCLKVATTGSIPNLHVFWVQETQAAASGGSYQLTFRARGTYESEASGDSGKPDVGIVFKDAEGQWIGHIPVPDVGFTDDWKDYQLEFTVPDNAATVGVRFGLHCRGGLATFLADDATLREGVQ